MEAVVECEQCGRRYAGPDLVGSRCPKCTGVLNTVALVRPEPRPDERIVEVYRAPDMVQAELIRQVLEADGILVAFRTLVAWGVHTFTVDGLGEVGILALESEAKRARKIVMDYLEQVSGDRPYEPEEQP